MRLFRIYAIIFILPLLLMVGAAAPVSAQNNTRVTGLVVCAEGQEPIQGVAISVNDNIVCYTNVDGQFSLFAPRDAVIRATHLEYSSTSVILDGDQQLVIRLKKKNILIKQVIVSSSFKRQKVSVDKTAIEVRGQYLCLGTNYSLPYKIFKKDHRFVAQPVIVNQTHDTTYLMRPVVIDGNRYDIIQHRWLNFGEAEDSLEQYIVGYNINKDNYRYSYQDSILIDFKIDASLKHDYYSDCYLALASYHEPPVYLDTVRIARGLANPIRNFVYDLRPMQLNNTLLDRDEEPYLIPTGVDTVYIPEYELELQHVSGEVNISFGVNSAKINYEDKKTKSNIAMIQDALSVLQHNPDARIKSISLLGNASPEGNYDANKALARRRTIGLQDIVLSKLDKEQLKYIELNIESDVVSWNKVADLAQADYPKLAAKIRLIFKQANNDYNAAYYSIKKMPEYLPIIYRKYLSPLRTVIYNIDYSIYKPLPYEKIRIKYDNGDSLSRYEYYVLISGEQDETLIPAMESAALKAYPNFIIFSNREAIRLIQKDSVNLDILKPTLAREDVPIPIVYNQTIMAIKADSLPAVNEISKQLRVTPETKPLHAAIDVLNSDYERAYNRYYHETNSINEVVLLLAMDRNDEAMRIMDKIMMHVSNQKKANYCYVYATCGKRVDDYNVAMTYLQMALELDPNYVNIALKDADLVEVYELLQN